MPALKDRTGERYGRLVVIGRAENAATDNRLQWLCQCDCGKRHAVRSNALSAGRTRSCGCLSTEAKTARRGPLSATYAEHVSYGGAHDRVRSARGSASEHSCVGCQGAASHWAYDHADPDEVMGERDGINLPYSLKVEHYQPMCVRCHKAFDLSRTLVVA